MVESIRLIIYKDNEKRFLEAIRTFNENFGYWPTTQQLAEFFTVSAATIGIWILDLVDKKAIRKLPGRRGWEVLDPRYRPRGILSETGKLTLEELCGGASQLIEVGEDFPHLGFQEGDLLLVKPVYDRDWLYVRNKKCWLTGKVIGFVRRLDGHSNGNHLGSSG